MTSRDMEGGFAYINGYMADNGGVVRQADVLGLVIVR